MWEELTTTEAAAVVGCSEGAAASGNSYVTNVRDGWFSRVMPNPGAVASLKAVDAEGRVVGETAIFGLMIWGWS